MRPIELSARELTLLAVCTALLFVSQAAMAALPNVEPVSLLIVLYTLVLGRKTLLVIFAFVLLEGALYGVHLWWFMYLYVWPLLWLSATVFARRSRTAVQWALLCGIYGLLFGGLCSVVYLPVSGVTGAFGWWVAGIPMDLIHGVSNFLLTLVLFHPLHRVMERAAALTWRDG